MRGVLRPCSTAAVAIVGASVVAITPLPPPAPDVQIRAVQLTGTDTADSPLGDGTALIVGATSVPTPNQSYIDFADEKYLDPRGFTGTSQPLTTPESLYGITGPFTETLDKSVSQGAQNVVNGVESQIAGGGVSAENPVVLFGYSQGSIVLADAQPQLAAAGVPSDDVHMVMVGDTSIPNGGLLERFDLPNGTDPTFPSLGLTFSSGQSSDLYPTDVYTNEYDGFADFPRYPIDFLADINAYLGIITQHLAYFGIPSEQIADAIQLPTSAADTLTNYYMIPAESLPLLDPLRLIPFLGNPLADLLQPDMSVLVNLGYGSITNGWSPGDADVQTPLGFLPPLSVLAQVPEALVNGLSKGITDAAADLVNPANYTNLEPPFLQELLASAPAASGGSIPADFSTVDFSVFPPHTGVPPIDVTEALLFNLPGYDANIFSSELADGNFLDAVGDPIAADLGISPLIAIAFLL
jgi:hypothetical protein